MVPLSELRPGMKVKIIDEWCDGCCQHSGGGMDKYLGDIVTILEVCAYSAKIEEDQDDADCRSCGQTGWYWWPNTFDCIVSDEAESAPDIDSIQDDMVLSFLFGH